MSRIWVKMGYSQFDHIIQAAMESIAKIGPWTHGKDLNQLQRAGTELFRMVSRLLLASESW